MANEFVKVTDQNGVDHPVKDNAAFPRSEQAVLGAKNRFADVLLTQFTDNADATHSLSDGVVSVVATSTNNSGLLLNQTYTRPAFSDITTPQILSMEMKADSACSVTVAVESTGILTQELTSDWVRYSVVIPDPSQMKILYFYNKSGSAQNFYIRKIMLYDANDTDSTYAPYAMTNKELTDAVEDAKDIKYTSDGTTYTRLKQYVVKPTITFSSGVGTATLYKPTGETIGSFAVACANSDKAVAHVNVSGTTATVTLTDTSYSSTAPVTIVYFTYKS